MKDTPVTERIERGLLAEEEVEEGKLRLKRNPSGKRGKEEEERKCLALSIHRRPSCT